jgi:hypothetical protein
MPVSLQFSNAPVERNVNGRSASSAHYLNGRPASQAEVIRARQQQEQLEQQRQGAGGFNWKSQPVGGRPGSALCADAAPVTPTAAANGSEHMFGAIGSPGANGFPGLVQPETTGKRILGGTIPAGSAMVQSVVFGRDGHVGVAATEMASLPAFKGAAGVPNEARSNGGGQARLGPRPAASFDSGAGMLSSEAAYHATPHFDGGPKGRRQLADRPGQQAAFAAAAGTNVGTPSALPTNPDGTLAWSSRRVNRPLDQMQDDMASAQPGPRSPEMRHVVGPTGPVAMHGPRVVLGRQQVRGR